jgi:ribosomal protein S18 acetylase RimI-like enzyme
MAVGLDRLVEDLPRPEALEVVEVERSDGILDPRFLEAWLAVNRETLAWPAEKVARRRGLYEGDDRRPRPWRHFVGLLDRRPVSASRVLVAGDVAMVHGVSTVPDARRRGIGSAVTLAALVAAREAGCRIGVLQASSMGQGPYRRLGFDYVAPYGRYVRDAATPFNRDDSAGRASEDAESAAA